MNKDFILGTVSQWLTFMALSMSINLGCVQTGLAKEPKNQVIATISVGNSPLSIVVSPDNASAYVVNYGSNSVSIIDTGTNMITTNITVGGLPVGSAITPDGKTLLVTNSHDSTVSVISISTGSVVATINVGPNPRGLGVTPDGGEAYVGNCGDGTVSIINVASQQVSATVNIGGFPELIAFVPVTSGYQAEVMNSSGVAGYLPTINVSTHQVSKGYPLAGEIFYPQGMAIAPGSSTVYITDEYNYAAVISGTAGRLQKALLAAGFLESTKLAQPAITPDGRFLYVPYYYNESTGTIGNQVAMIDLRTGRLNASQITVGNFPYWLASSPNGTRLYVANAGDNTVSVVDITLQ